MTAPQQARWTPGEDAVPECRKCGICHDGEEEIIDGLCGVCAGTGSPYPCACFAAAKVQP